MTLSGNGDAFSKSRNQSDIRQARRKQSVSPSISVGTRSFARLSHHTVSMLLRWCLEKDIGPNIEKKLYMGRIAHLASTSNTITLISNVAKSSICGKAVLQIAAHCPGIYRQPDGFADRIWCGAIAAFQIDCD